MIKSLCIVISLTLAHTLGKCQEEIFFKVGYLPNNDYTLSQVTFTENNVKYIASEEFLKNLKNNGVANPTIRRDTSGLSSMSRTGAPIEEHYFPIEVEILISTNPALASGTVFHGWSIDGVTTVDSITSSTMSDAAKAALIGSAETMLNQIKYPERMIAIGESFEQKSPMTMPLSDVVMDIEVNSVFTLSKIENGIGYFDLDQVYTLKAATKNYEMALEGVGSGHIEYDVDKQFITKFYLDMEMSLAAELELFSIEFLTKSTTSQKTVIAGASR